MNVHLPWYRMCMKPYHRSIHNELSARAIFENNAHSAFPNAYSPVPGTDTTACHRTTSTHVPRPPDAQTWLSAISWKRWHDTDTEDPNIEDTKPLQPAIVLCLSRTSLLPNPFTILLLRLSMAVLGRWRDAICSCSRTGRWTRSATTAVWSGVPAVS